jgi:hypothetical protein
MDALVVEQYGYLLAVLVGALAAGSVLVLILNGRAAATRAGADEAAVARPRNLPNVMMLLVALAVGAGILLLLPAAMVLRYFPHWRVGALLMGAAVILGAPLLYAWRARPR